MLCDVSTCLGCTSKISSVKFYVHRYKWLEFHKNNHFRLFLRARLLRYTHGTWHFDYETTLCLRQWLHCRNVCSHTFVVFNAPTLGLPTKCNNNHLLKQCFIFWSKTATPSNVCIHNILKASLYHRHPYFQYDSGNHAWKGCTTWILFFWSKQNSWACSNGGGQKVTLLMAYVFYMFSVW